MKGRNSLPYFISKRLSAHRNNSFTKLISKIAIGSVALGVGALILAFSIFYGFKEGIEDKLFLHVGHLNVEKFTMNRSKEEPPVNVNNSDLHNYKEELPHVKNVYNYAHKWGLLKSNEEVAGLLIKGLSKDYQIERWNKEIVAGRFPSLEVEKNGAKEIMISKSLATKMHLKVNDDIIIYFIQKPPKARKMKISGIYSTGLEDFDDMVAYGDINLVRRLNNWGDSLVGGMEIIVDDFDKLDDIGTEIDEEYVDVHLHMRSVKDKYAHFFDWFHMLYNNVWIFLIVIVSVAIFNVISIMLILIMERTAMIGTFKALGANNNLLQKIFIFDGIRMAVKGMLIGNGVALIFGVVQQKFKIIPLEASTYYLDHVPFSFHWDTIFLINITIIVLTSLGLLIPSSIVLGISPIKSIKFN
ncbi:ABC transporter permease [Flammeovirga yaeyamensis]|uniref:ABC transporter permease n=1 Tax=Flammeovirga yaeyamensis TaxID=367791 RepID=A0AAX1MYA1_9BACT|nr:ABC transporter permease [Flammeovirga yaeyamensis]MBB3696274.1 lipoprotein-releasing system permease protein [Flammeovirga yaeyamensis]NMF34955.1 ABC transporter permease [Flammeovirga yaeyamensis]QWG00220.1 ABC transporter permease [Flammeovirga yaeyamensis]